MPDRKREGQNFKARTLLKRIQKELKTTKGYNGKSVFEADFNEKGEKTISTRKVSSAIVAGFDVAKRKVTGQENRNSLLLKEKKIKHMIGDLKAIDSKIYYDGKQVKDSKGKVVQENERKKATMTNSTPQGIKKSRRTVREAMR
tara:strand:+ start:227 stop:658 length:432 start_codon:yes stop_codon:yes gene_type:complete